MQITKHPANPNCLVIVSDVTGQHQTNGVIFEGLRFDTKRSAVTCIGIRGREALRRELGPPDERQPIRHTTGSRVRYTWTNVSAAAFRDIVALIADMENNRRLMASTTIPDAINTIYLLRQVNQTG